jgi:hypothetical protein
MRLRVTTLALLVWFGSAAGLACSGDAADPDPVSDACDDYCTLAIRNCMGTVSQYSDLSACLATCEVIPLGTAGDRAGNTVACRTFWAGASEGNPEQFCRRAGPGGDDTCGSNCESFCAITLALCEDTAMPPYESIAACMTACAGFDTSDPYDSNDLSGDSLGCRIYHMIAAAGVPAEHCPHTLPISVTCTGPPSP